MKKMRENSDNYGDGAYRIVDCGNYYIVVIASDKANVMRTYEYDAGCGSIEEVEKELKEHTFDEIKAMYREQCVYCECEEMIR